MNNEPKEFAIRITSRDECRAVQLKAFDLGYIWAEGTREIVHLEAKNITFTTKKKLWWSDSNRGESAESFLGYSPESYNIY